MRLPPSLDGLIAHERQALGPLTTLGVGGPAPWVLEPRDRAELSLAVRELVAAGLPFRMLGHGSNLLVSDRGVDEIVVATRQCRNVGRDPERPGVVRADAGVSLARLVSVAHDLSLAGAEALIGIPGTVGGAVAGNAGGRNGAIGDVLVSVTVLEPDGTLHELPCEPRLFGYRRSPFRGKVVLDASVGLRPDAQGAIAERMRAILQAKIDSQPLAARSAGCIFRNDPLHGSGRLIDEAGCKALREGGAQVSARHANFILNTGGATATDVARLVRRVRERVAEHSGVELQLEVEVWGGDAHFP